MPTSNTELGSWLPVTVTTKELSSAMGLGQNTVSEGISVFLMIFPGQDVNTGGTVSEVGRRVNKEWYVLL